MTPVDQTIFEDHHGNCYAACIASLLDLPLDKVPNFIDLAGQDGNMTSIAAKWLEERGWALWECHYLSQDDISHVFWGHRGPKHCILSGVSPRRRADGSKKWHATVGKVGGYGIEMAHDPHPSRAGLVEGTRWVTFLLPLPRAFV